MRGAYRIVSGLYPGQRRGGELFRRVLRRIAGAESALASGRVEERREKYFRKYLFITDPRDYCTVRVRVQRRSHR